MNNRRAVGMWLAIGAFAAGAFDITYAVVVSYLRSGIAPSRVLQSVASGLLGRAAYDGGARTAALGLALHFLNAFIITAIFFVAARSRPALLRRPVVTGVAYGLVVYLVMNYVVIPLSAIGAIPHKAAVVWITEGLTHMFLVGISIVLAARRTFLRHAG